MLTMRNNQTKTTYMKHKRRTDNNGLGGVKLLSHRRQICTVLRRDTDIVP